MIVADTSAIVAIFKEESDQAVFETLVASETAAIGAPSLVETKLALSSVLRPADVDALLGTLVARGGLTPVPFTPDMADAAVEAFRRYGKGQGHRAQLNFGDCMAYAVAKVLGAPLLFTGDDFAQTDIEPAWRP